MIESKVTGIYQIQSKVHPDRVYIGSSVDINKRWKEHLYWLHRRGHHSPKLQRHFLKYNDLIFTILETCVSDTLISREQYYIDILNPYFNVCKIAGSVLGIKRSEETKHKLRIKQLGRVCSEATKEKLRVFNTGRSSGRKGVKASTITIQRLKESHKNQRPTEEMIRHRAEMCKKPVLQFSKDMEFIKEYPSIIDTPFRCKNAISACCTGGSKSSYGFIWKHK